MRKPWWCGSSLYALHLTSMSYHVDAALLTSFRTWKIGHSIPQPLGRSVFVVVCTARAWRWLNENQFLFLDSPHSPRNPPVFSFHCWAPTIVIVSHGFSVLLFMAAAVEKKIREKTWRWDRGEEQKRSFNDWEEWIFHLRLRIWRWWGSTDSEVYVEMFFLLWAWHENYLAFVVYCVFSVY